MNTSKLVLISMLLAACGAEVAEQEESVASEVVGAPPGGDSAQSCYEIERACLPTRGTVAPKDCRWDLLKQCQNECAGVTRAGIEDVMRTYLARDFAILQDNERRACQAAGGEFDEGWLPPGPGAPGFGGACRLARAGEIIDQLGAECMARKCAYFAERDAAVQPPTNNAQYNELVKALLESLDSARCLSDWERGQILQAFVIAPHIIDDGQGCSLPDAGVMVPNWCR